MAFIQGDCLQVMQTFSDRQFDYGFTSPPYNRKRNDKYEKYDDTLDDYYSFLCSFTDELKRICSKGFFVNVQKNYYNKAEVLKYMGNYADDIQEIIIWEKTNPMPASGKNITNAWEFFLYFSDKPLKAKHTYTKNIISTSVNSKMPKEHKAVMKQDVADYFVSEFFEEGSSVIDCFGGLGTTEIACLRHGMKCTSIELQPTYIAIAEERIRAES